MTITTDQVFQWQAMATGTPASPTPAKQAAMQMVVDAVEQHYADNYLPPMHIRDLYGVALTYGSATLSHAGFVAADVGHPVSGDGIPQGAKITAVAAGVSATLADISTGSTVTAFKTGTSLVTIGDRANPMPRNPRGANVDLALIMQAHRLAKRAGSPEGVAGISEMGPVRVSQFDPDIERMLIRKPLLR